MPLQCQKAAPGSARRNAGPTRLLHLGALGVTVAVAFDIDAHDAIGQTCASAMDQEATRQVKRLLGGQDASDVAGWGHQVDETFPGIARLHFQVHDDRNGQPWCGPSEGRMAHCQDGICLLNAIKHFYGKVLADEGRKIDYPAIDYSKVEKGVKFTDADAVKMLINLLGDLHQPLHVGFASDDNGHATHVKFRGKTVALYDLWDKSISERIREEESGFWLGGWTHVRAVKDQFEKDKELWKTEGPFKSFERWLDETVQFACAVAYTHPTTGKKLAGPSAEQGQIPEIDEGAYHAWKESWLKQILIAGERTAIVLNDILDASGASKLGQGSGVNTKADQEKKAQEAEWEKERVARRAAERAARGFLPSMSASVFATNLGIACVVVPLFLLFVQHGLNPKVHMQVIKAILDGTGSAPSGAGSGGGRQGKRFE